MVVRSLQTRFNSIVLHELSMSWRVLIIFLLLAAVASWQGGTQLGEWLVLHAPESIVSASGPKTSKDQVLDANGKPFAAQPPQPRIDGTLGVPREHAPAEWTITAVVANSPDANSNAMNIDADGNAENEEHELVAGGAGLLSGTHDVATLDVATAPKDTASNARQWAGSFDRPAPQEAKPAPQVSARPATAAEIALVWQQALRKDIDQCNKLGFFQRPTCVQTARNKFCAPNYAWGKTADCPPKGFDQTGGN
jgi:hypothetical protein